MRRRKERRKESTAGKRRGLEEYKKIEREQMKRREDPVQSIQLHYKRVE